MQRVLIFGGNGFVGREVARGALNSGHMPIIASRRPLPFPGCRTLAVDITDTSAVLSACRDADVVVNCVAGNATTMIAAATNIAHAVSASQIDTIVHLSSMAVYGSTEGYIDETTAFGSNLGWYGAAKCKAENILNGLTPDKHVIILRPGCIIGPGSHQWVGRIAKLLQTYRIGDIGAAGDGWSNLVEVGDVAAAVLASFTAKEEKSVSVFNLACDENKRWNEYFIALGLAINATPIRRISSRRLKIDSKLTSVVLKLMQLIAARMHINNWPKNEPLPPSLLRLWSQQVRLNSEAASAILLPSWTSFDESVKSSAEWILTGNGAQK